MKTKITIFLYLFFGAFITTKAQVKIGNNPGTINASAILEMETTNKGLLVPRVSLTSTSDATTIASATTSLLIYNTATAGSSPNIVIPGYYYWNGTKWIAFATSTNVRTNYVLVKTASDFPAAVSGIRTLVANTTYEINGTITLTDKIALNTAVIKGGDATKDILLYTPTSGELFTGANGGTLKELTLTASGVGGKVFNVDAGGSVQNFIVQDCFINNSTNIGTIKGIGGTVFFNTIAFQSNTNGITFDGIGNLILVTMLWDNTNSNTYVTLTNAFNVIQLTGGDIKTLSGNTATGLNISGVTTITTGADLKTVFFGGTGTYVTGTFSNKWEVEAQGLTNQKDAEATGNLYISATALSVIVTQNIAVKVAGTTTPVNLFRVTMPTNNKLTYTGTKTSNFQIICSLTGTAVSANINFSFSLYKNGILLPESTQSVKLASGATSGGVTLSCVESLATNDYIEVYVTNNSDASDITIANLNLSIR